MKIRQTVRRSRSLMDSITHDQSCFWGAIVLMCLTLGPVESYGLMGSGQGSLVQWTQVQRGTRPYPQPYPQPYPPTYYPPPQPDSYNGSRQARPAGWIHVEVEPRDAEVFLDGNKMEASGNNEYEEGVFIGRHRLDVKKEGYLDHMEFVDVQTATKQRVKISLKKIQ
jgi:hypothetical protein